MSFRRQSLHIECVRERMGIMFTWIDTLVQFIFSYIFLKANISKCEHESGVGVPMFWPDWQDQKMRQHQNHIQTSGSSPPGSREGSLYMGKGCMYLKLCVWDVRLVIGTRFVCLIFCLVVGNQKGRVQYKTRMRKKVFRQRKDNSESIQDHWAMDSGKGLLAIQYAGFQLG